VRTEELGSLGRTQPVSDVIYIMYCNYRGHIDNLSVVKHLKKLSGTDPGTKVHLHAAF
jgi:hypothetical protein